MIVNTNRTDFFKKGLFKDINLNDPFFDTLKEDYKEFEEWYQKKSHNQAFYFENNMGIQAFLYLKLEDEDLNDIVPPLPKKKRVKVGTLKINPHGTKFGDRFIKKAIDYALENKTEELYVTVFSKHVSLINLLEKYGFKKWGQKTTQNGTEYVLVKDISKNSFNVDDEIHLSYPLISKSKNSFILSIWPKFHSRLLPDSILNTEVPYDVIQDISYANSIEKIYICRMEGVSEIKPKDQIVIYRTAEKGKYAEYSSVATSICNVVEVKSKSDFKNVDEVIDYCAAYSIFSEDEIRQEYYGKKTMYIIKMLYAYALPKRLIRKSLIEDCKIDRGEYWGIMKLTEHQFGKILELGEVNESIIVD